MIRESVVTLSDDITHDACAIAAFRERLVQHLQDKGIKVSHLIEWCDSARSQYKLAQTFLHISEDAGRYEITITHCFHGSEHGKDESDGETGTVKTKLVLGYRSHHY